MKSVSITKPHNTQKQLITLCAYFGALVALYFISSVVFASGEGQSLGAVAENVTKSMTNVGKLIVAASYVAGVGFALMGMMKFKAHKDNPQQVPLSQPIVLLAIAAGLVFIPSLVSTGGTTLFGESAERGSATGTGVEGMGGN